MRALIISLVFAALGGSPLSAETGFLDRSVTIAGEPFRYQVYVPAEWTSNEKWPVILFLHGAGERGQDGLLPTEVGLGAAVRRARVPYSWT